MRTGAVKSYCNTPGDEPVSKLLRRLRSPDYSCSPGRATGLRSQPPAPKGMTSNLAPAYSALEAGLRGQWPAHAVGNPWTPGRRTWAPPGIFVDRSYVTLCWPALLRRALAGCALDIGPNVKAASLPDSKKLSYYHRVTPSG